jgi:predicted CoA-binding protein
MIARKLGIEGGGSLKFRPAYSNQLPGLIVMYTNMPDLTNSRNPVKKTLVLGASDNPARYSFLAVTQLRAKGHPVVAIGRKRGKVADTEIEYAGNTHGTTQETGVKEPRDIDTVTLYLNPGHQKEYYHYILSLHPKRIIFNPGTENEELSRLAKAQGIHSIEACTLVLLSTGQY